MDEKKKLILVVGTGVIVSLVLTILFRSMVTLPITRQRMYFETFLGVKVFISTLNIVLICALLWNYMRIYKEIPNRFTLSLIIFSLALLLYAVFSNPFIPFLLGFKHGVGLGPFTFLPDMFATIAVIILLYQSYE